jgi:TonB-linked SusC/RagA family outer membrane protein
MKLLTFGTALVVAAAGFAPLQAQQSGTIRGRVTDEASQAPLRGVVVRFGNQAAESRDDGRYVLTDVPAGSDSLRVAMIGYAPAARPVTVAAGETVEVDVALAPQAVNLAELVVVGYGEQRQGNVTGALTNVTSQEFNKGRVVTPTELIQNKVAGVQVVESTEPGGKTSIRIRGGTSTTASNEPLYVVDGQVLGTDAGGGVSSGRDPLNFINPDDIASMTVLRDAGAAAIYGTNAANGVILITTKRGQSGQPMKLEYTGSLSASTITRTPSMLDAQQFRAAVEQFAPGSLAQLQNENTDWYGAIDRTGFGQEHNVALSGGGVSNDYRVSFNFLDQRGLIQENSARRMGLGVNFNQRLAEDRLNLRLSLRGSRSDDRFTPLGVLSNATQYGPTQPITDGASPTGFYEWPNNSSTSADNPVAILNLAEEKAETYRAIGNLQTEYRLPWVDGLRANVTLGFDASDGVRRNFLPSVLHRETATGRGGQQTRYNPQQTSTLLETYLNYTTPRPVGPGILDLTGGYSWTKTHTDSIYYEGNGLSSDEGGTDQIVRASNVTTIEYEQQSKLISFFGRLNYNINDKYIFAATLRHDGSSRFGGENDFGTFPSLSAAWRLSQEPFFRGVGGLSDLKLRASWAKTGNQSFGNYLFLSSYQGSNTGATYQFGDTVFTTSRPSAVDPDIKWEQTRAVNVGLDFGFANQRITGAIDYYDKLTTDLLFTVPVAAFSNLSNFLTTNIGSMRNYGVELSLGARILDGGERGLSWQADFTAARNKNNLRSITPFGGSALSILVGEVSGGVGTRIQVLTPNHPVNSFYVYEHIRENGQPIYRDVDGDSDIDNDDLYVDQNGDGVVNQSDLRPFHDPSPKWILGHSSYFAWGKMDFGFTLRSYIGNYAYNNVASTNGNYRELTAGSSPYNLHESVLETQFATQQLQSDFYVQNASFLRMDNMTLGYTFNMRGQAARVFGTVQNLFTITGYDGVDPAANIVPPNAQNTSTVNGIDNNIYPRSRTFSAGLSLTL